MGVIFRACWKIGTAFIALALLTTGVLPAGAAEGVAPALRVLDLSIIEGNAGITDALVTIELDKPSGRIVTVDYGTTVGTASPGLDHAIANGTATFNKRQTLARVVVPIVGDTLFEPDETFGFRLSNSGGGAVIADAAGIVTIVNDDVETPPDPPGDLALTISTDPADDVEDFIVARMHRVDVAFTNEGNVLTRDVKVRLTFDSVQVPQVDEQLDHCALTKPTELLCSYGDTREGGTFSIGVRYDYPRIYTIGATVESLTQDPAPGNNSRTAVLNVRNMRADLAANIGIDFPDFDNYSSIRREFPQGYSCRNCGELTVFNEGPDPVHGLGFRYFTTGGNLFPGEYFDQSARVCAVGSVCRSDIAVSCVTDGLVHACTVAFAGRPLRAGETLGIDFLIGTNYLVQSPVQSGTLNVRLDRSENPDRTVVDEVSVNDEAQTDANTVHVVTDLRPYLLSGTSGDASMVAPCDATGLPCEWYMIGGVNRGFWRADAVRVRVEIPTNVHVEEFPTACTLLEPTLALPRNVLSCPLGNSNSRVSGGTGYWSVITGRDGDVHPMDSIGNTGYVVEHGGQGHLFKVSYLTPGEVTFRASISGECSPWFMDECHRTDDPTNDVMTLTRMVTL